MESGCDLDKFIGMLHSTASMEDEILDLISSCGYVETASHRALAQVLRDVERRYGYSLLVLVYGESGTGKSFFARTVQQKFLAEAREKVRRAFMGEAFSYVTLPVYVNLMQSFSGGVSDYETIAASISNAIGVGVLSTLVTVYDMKGLEPVFRLREFLQKVGDKAGSPEFLPVLFSLMRFGGFKYFIILDELSRVVGSLSTKEDVDRFVNIVLDKVVRQWKESLGNLLLGFMLIVNVAREEALNVIREYVESGGLVAYGGSLERFEVEEISDFMPASDEAVIEWLRGANIDNLWVARVYRSIVGRYKFRFATYFLQRYILNERTKSSQEIHAEVSKRLEELLVKVLKEKFPNKQVEPYKSVGSMKCDVLMGNYCIDVKVLGTPEDVDKEAVEDLQKMGTLRDKYRLIYAVVSDRSFRPYLTHVAPNVDVVAIEVPELDRIYEALRQAEGDAMGSSSSGKACLLSAANPRSSVDFREIFLQLIADEIVVDVKNLLKKRSKGAYDLTVYASVEEDCKTLHGRTRSDWLSAKSLRNVWGKRLKKAAEVDEAVALVNEKIKGSGLRLEVKDSHVYCVEE